MIKNDCNQNRQLIKGLKTKVMKGLRQRAYGKRNKTNGYIRNTQPATRNAEPETHNMK